MIFRAKMWCGNAVRQPPRYTEPSRDVGAAHADATYCAETHAIVERMHEPWDPGAGTIEDPTCNCGIWFLKHIVK